MFKLKTKGKKRKEIQEFAQREAEKGLLFQLPGGSSHLDVYVDHCVIRCKGKTKMEEKSREIPFTSIQKVVYTPLSGVRNGCLQLFTKEMPDVKQSYWYAYENNLVVVHPTTEELARKIAKFISDPYGSGFVSPERMNLLKKEAKKAREAVKNGPQEPELAEEAAEQAQDQKPKWHFWQSKPSKEGLAEMERLEKEAEKLNDTAPNETPDAPPTAAKDAASNPKGDVSGTDSTEEKP